MSEACLKEILEIQKEFTDVVIQKRFGKKIEDLTWQEKQEFFKDLVLHLSEEAHEFLREINWKMHRKHDKIFDEYKGRMELIDIFKFFSNFLILLNISPEQFYNDFIYKSRVVWKKWKEECQNEFCKYYYYGVGCSIIGNKCAKQTLI